MADPERTSGTLAGRRALVTGASGRLGRAIALALAAQGAQPILHYRRDRAGAEETLRLLAQGGVASHALQADLSGEGACEALVRETRERLGGLDLLVNNAAIFRRGPLEEMTAHDFDEHMASNARPVYELTLHAGRRMHARGGGDVINIADVAAFSPWPAYIAYSASKAAVVNLTKSFAQALAPQVRVNAIAPGPILPPTIPDEERDDAHARAQGEAAVEATLLRRWGKPQDITSAVLFLLRAKYVTGYTLSVDGGRSIAAARDR